MFRPKIDERYVGREVCEAYRALQDDRWKRVETGMEKIERVVGKFNVALLTLLGGLVVTLLMLILNLVLVLTHLKASL